MSEPTEAEENAPEPPAEPEPARKHGVLVTESPGHIVYHPSVEEYAGLVTTLRDDEHMELFVDLTAVDFLTHPGRTTLAQGVQPERFELVLHLRSLSLATRCRVRVQLADGQAAPSIVDTFPGAETPEREVFDMFGIEFTDHPDLSRILMPEEWVGHPLRKDYGVGRIPVQFKGVQ